MQWVKSWMCVFTLFSVILVIYTLTSVKTRDKSLAQLVKSFPSKPRQFSTNITATKTSPSLANMRKNILYYTTMWGTKDFHFGTGSKVFEKCEYTNCFVSHNQSLMAIDEWDAILFHMAETAKWIKPKKRKPHQRYVFSAVESPIQTFNNLKKYSNFFNYTMTYRRDSDARWTYGTVLKRRTDYEPPSLEKISSRPDKIAWFVSHCKAKSKRDMLYRAINRLIPVDVYGKCGPLICENRTQCFEMLEQNYKFYLSFENAICADYITEKTFLPLKYNVIPIVYSGANLSEVTPPNSVIDVQSFKSVEALVDYIKFLDEHPEEYLKYFEWKKEYVVKTTGRPGMCNLCKKLHEDGGKKKEYGDMETWWRGPESANYCRTTFIDKFLK